MAGSGGMPYVLAENDLLTALEGTNRSQRIAGLRRLVARDSIWESPVGAVSSDHLRAHWFGYDVGQDPAANATPLMPPRSNTFATGWWAHWWGNAHEILRQTLQRVYQASLHESGDNLDSEEIEAADLDALNANSTMCRPIRLVWMCGAMQMQGFVIVEGDGPDDLVTGIIATPGTDPNWDGMPAAAHPIMTDAVILPSGFKGAQRNIYVVGHSDVNLVEHRPRTFVKCGTPSVSYDVLETVGSVVTAPLTQPTTP